MQSANRSPRPVATYRAERTTNVPCMMGGKPYATARCGRRMMGELICFEIDRLKGPQWMMLCDSVWPRVGNWGGQDAAPSRDLGRALKSFISSLMVTELGQSPDSDS